TKEELEGSLDKNFWENAEPEGGWGRFWDQATLGVSRLTRGFMELSKESDLAETIKKASAEIRRLKNENIKLDEEIGIIVDPTALQKKVQDELDKHPVEARVKVTAVSELTEIDDVIFNPKLIRNTENI